MARTVKRARDECPNEHADGHRPAGLSAPPARSAGSVSPGKRGPRHVKAAGGAGGGNPWQNIATRDNIGGVSRVSLPSDAAVLPIRVQYIGGVVLRRVGTVRASYASVRHMSEAGHPLSARVHSQARHLR